MIKKTTELAPGDRLLYPKGSKSEIITVLGISNYTPGVRESDARAEGVNMAVDFRHAPTWFWRKGRKSYMVVKAYKTWVTA